MIDYLKTNHLGILIIIVLMGMSFMGDDNLGALDTTTNTNPQVFNQSISINESGGNFDFRVEGDTETALLFTDASTDQVGIGTTTPQVTFQVDGTFVQGGSKFSTTTSDAGTFTAAQMCDNALITADLDTSSVTLTMPTAALLMADCVQAIGDSKTILFENSTTTAAITATIAAGANVILVEHDGGDVIIPGDEWAEIMFLNIDGTNVYMSVKSMRDAD